MNLEFLRRKRVTLVVMGLAIVAWVQSCAGGWEHRTSDASALSCERLASKDGALFWQSCTMGRGAEPQLWQGGPLRMPEGFVVGPGTDDADLRTTIRCGDLDVVFAAPEPGTFLQLSSTRNYQRTADGEWDVRTIDAALGYVLVVILCLLSLALAWLRDLNERRTTARSVAEMPDGASVGLVSQPTPDVSRADVERVVRRDFPAGRVADVLGLLDGIDGAVAEPERARARTQLAVLKLAGADVDALKARADVAKMDPRDVIAPAEYPEYFRRWGEIGNLPQEEQRRVIDADWGQYERWLRA